MTVQGQVQKRGFLDRVLGLVAQPLSGINEVLSLIGVPLFRNATGGDPTAQARQIAIADLQVKIAEIQKQRGDLADKLREQVLLAVLDLDTLRRDFQIGQEIAKREGLRHRLMEADYRFGQGETSAFLGNLSALDRQKAETYRQWTRLRSAKPPKPVTSIFEWNLKGQRPSIAIWI